MSFDDNGCAEADHGDLNGSISGDFQLYVHNAASLGGARANTAALRPIQAIDVHAADQLLTEPCPNFHRDHSVLQLIDECFNCDAQVVVEPLAPRNHLFWQDACRDECHFLSTDTSRQLLTAIPVHGGGGAVRAYLA